MQRNATAEMVIILFRKKYENISTSVDIELGIRTFLMMRPLLIPSVSPMTSYSLLILFRQFLASRYGDPRK